MADAGLFTLDMVIGESERLDLAFARALDATLARRYADSARLQLISDQQLDRLVADPEAYGAFLRDLQAVRDADSTPRTDRAA